MASCPVFGTDPAVAVVESIEQTVLAVAQEAWGTSQQNIAALNAFEVQPYNFQVSFNLDAGLTAFQRPDRPEDPDDLDFDPHIDIPVLAQIQWPDVQLGSAPHFNQSVPTIFLPSPPQMIVPDVPDEPLLTDVVIPSVPAYTLPAVPVMRSITLPADPNIVIATFTAIAPSRNFDVPPFDFEFNYTPYSDQLLNDVKARLSTMLQGGTGLPAAIEQALYDRDSARQDQADAKAMTEVLEDFSGRGFREPNGLLYKKMSEVRQNNRNVRASASRDVLIRNQDVLLENLRFSVSQGIALEQVLIDLHFKAAALMLDAAKYSQEAMERVLNVRIAILNADTAIFVAQATVYRDLLAGELAKLDIYKAKIDAQRLIGEVNREDIQLYEAQLQSVGTLISIYKAQIDGANAISANNNAKIQGFNGLIQARSETIRALGFQFDAYKTQTEAEKIKGDIYDTSARAFGSLVSAYGIGENIKTDKGRFEIQRGQAMIDEWRTRVTTELEEVRTEALVITTKLDKFRAFLDRYRTDANVEETAEAANARAFSLLLEKEKSTVDTQLKNVQLIIEQIEKRYGILLEAMKSSAMVGAQVTGSALSALNVGARLDSTYTTSRGYQYSCS